MSEKEAVTQQERSLSILSDFIANMADINFDHNPLSRYGIFILNNKSYDHYQDAVTYEEDRVLKKVILKKDEDLVYVQESDDNELLEDTDQIPWLASLTATGLPRNPRAEDSILVGDILYTIAKVKPINRQTQSVFNCIVYPERTKDDPLQIYKADYNNGLLSIVWGGQPLQIGFSEDSIADSSLRVTFRPYYSLKDKPEVLIVFDNRTFFKYHLE